MFPNSSMSLVEEVYRGNRVADLFNELLGDAVTAFIEERLAREPAARLRILEVGAGTGGTTAGLLERLRPFRGAIDEYCYTDISKAFLMHAQERYVPSHPFVTTRISRCGAVSRRAADSGRLLRHRTCDELPSRDEEHSSDAAQREGHAAARRWTFLERDARQPALPAPDVRVARRLVAFRGRRTALAGQPGISAENWCRVLREEGYGEAVFPAVVAHPLGQQIIAAESDGCVWQAPVEVANPRDGGAGAPMKSEVASAGDDRLEERVRAIVRTCIGQALKMDDADIQDDRSFSEYGVDVDHRGAAHKPAQRRLRHLAADDGAL